MPGFVTWPCTMFQSNRHKPLKTAGVAFRPRFSVTRRWLYIYTDEIFHAVGLPLPVASPSSDIRRSISDRNFTERNPEAPLGAVDKPRPANLGRERTLLRSTGRSGCSCGVFQLHPIQRRLSLLGLDCADCVSGDQDNLVGTIQCSGRPQLGHNSGAHFFVGAPPHYPEGNVTILFYTSLSYTLGALLDAGNVFRFQHPSAGAGRSTAIAISLNNTYGKLACTGESPAFFS